jgi:hypothetical protein
MFFKSYSQMAFQQYQECAQLSLNFSFYLIKFSVQYLFNIL